LFVGGDSDGEDEGSTTSEAGPSLRDGVIPSPGSIGTVTVIEYVT